MRLLFWHDARVYQLIDRLARYFDVQPLIVDPCGVFKRGREPESVDSLEVARATYPAHEWVWICPEGDTILDEFEHPSGEDTIYCVGCNVDDVSPHFGDLPGHHVRLRRSGIVWDYQAAQMALYDREIYLAGRRR
jgi:hypothetical protein